MVILTDYGYGKRFSEDGFNRYGKRKQTNTVCPSYNCGGFALGTFSWYVPVGDDLLDYALEIGAISEEEKAEIEEDITEDAYYWAKEDFLYDYSISSFYSLNNHSLNCIPEYNSWRTNYACSRLEDYIPSLMGDKSPFMDYFVEVMLNEIDGLRLITDLSEIKEDEYCVAFRIGHGDFHYVRSNNNKCNTWIDKIGSLPVRKIDLKEERKRRFENPFVKHDTRPEYEKMFDILFGLRYCSRTILFAKKNGG